MSISKCFSCKNASICKWRDRMKEYEDKIKELYGHRHEIEPCPVSIGVSCSKYEINTSNLTDGSNYYVPSSSSNNCYTENGNHYYIVGSDHLHYK